jgi:hypothetical protein
VCWCRCTHCPHHPCHWSRSPSHHWGCLIIVCCSHPRSTLRAVACRHGGMCWVIPLVSWGTGAILHCHGAPLLLLSCPLSLWSPLSLLLSFLPPFRLPCRRSTYHPPHEQLLARLEVGGVSSVGIVVVVIILPRCFHCLHHLPSTLRTGARSGGSSGCSSLLLLSFHPQSTPRAVAHEVGGRWWVSHRHRSSFAPPGVVIGPLAPPIHPASRCSQLWRGCGSWWNVVVVRGCIAAPYAVLLASAVTWQVMVVWGCVPGGHPPPGVSQHPSAPS